MLDGNNHTLDYSINTKLNLYGEKREIESAFKNIITNAIRYTGKGGQINIRWNLINELGVFEVTDSGIGIPKKILIEYVSDFIVLMLIEVEKQVGQDLVWLL